MFSRKTTDVFNSIFDEALEVIGNLSYPPYSVYNKDGVGYVEMAVAGYPKEDISIKVEQGYLFVEGKKQPLPTEEKNFSFNGISRKAFSSKFKISHSIETIDAEYDNGILKIKLVPKEKSSFNVNIK